MNPTSNDQIKWEETPLKGTKIYIASTLSAFLDQLVKAGKLKQFMQQLESQGDRPTTGL